MRIALGGSMAAFPEIERISNELKKMGYETSVPKFSEGELEILRNGGSYEDIHGESTQAKIDDDLLRYFYGEIRDSDAFLVVNIERKGIPGYVGGNTFLEMGFAHVLNKPVYFMHQIPEMPYTDEILAMQPIVLNGDLSLIKQEDGKRFQEIFR